MRILWLSHGGAAVAAQETQTTAVRINEAAEANVAGSTDSRSLAGIRGRALAGSGWTSPATSGSPAPAALPSAS